MPLSSFQQRVQAELISARKQHAKQNSLHEGYAVLLEEVEEFWEEVRKRRSARNPVAILEELVQVAAMAQFRKERGL